MRQSLAIVTLSSGLTSKRMKVTSVTLATSMNTKIVFSLFAPRCDVPRLLSLFGPPSSLSAPSSPASQRKFNLNFFFFHEICSCALSSRSGSPNVRFVHAWTPTWMIWVVCSLQRKDTPTSSARRGLGSLPGAKPTSRRRRRRRRRQQQDAPREEGGDPQRPADARAPLGCFCRRGRVFAGNAG